MKRWFSSDLHIGHKNILTYCKRPFENVEQMLEYIIKTWNETVNSEDEVYILGDFSLNPKHSQIVNQLNGIKTLISGNHDATFPRENSTKWLKMVERYKEDGWKEVLKDHSLTLSDGTFVLLNHFPYYTEEYDQRYKDKRPKNQGSILLHGHEHGRYIKNGKMIDVSFDAHDLKLISEERIIEIINDPREFIPSSLTEFYKQREDDRNE